jgi:signal transduction histidine kinase
LRHTKLLLVEDNSIDAFVFKGFVEAMPGWKVDHVARLGAARQLVDELTDERYDLVVVDLSLPDATGLEAVHFARDRLPEAVCVVVTGESLLDTAVQAMRDGASDYLLKDDLQPRAVQRALQFALLRRNMVRQVEESARNLRGVLGAMHDALYVVDGDGRVLFQNSAASRFVPPFRGEDSILTLQPHAGGDVVEQTVIQSAEGDEVSVEARSSRLNWAGGVATMVVLRDLSAEQAAAELRDRARRVENMAELGDAAMKDWHDVRKKLMYMASATDTLRSDDNDEEAREAVQVLVEAQDAILAIAERYRKQAVQMRNVRRPVDVVALVRSACSRFSHRMEEVARLHLRLAPVPEVLGDDVELGVAIDNVMSNALEALAENEVEDAVVRVSTHTSDGQVRIEITDNGPGFPPGPIDHWFQERHTGRTGGTGLGLPRVREVARSHGGDVMVQSTAGEGATVCIRLPVAVTSPTKVGRRILLVEDDRMVARATRRMLTRHYEVEVAEDGRAALDILENDTAFDVILCDLEMPRVDGRQFYEQLEVERPDLAERVAFCSGGASTPEMLAFLKTAKPQMLPKPFTPDALVALIEAMVG